MEILFIFISDTYKIRYSIVKNNNNVYYVFKNRKRVFITNKLETAVEYTLKMTNSDIFYF